MEEEQSSISIDVAKDIAKDVIAFYNLHFTEIPVSVKKNKKMKIFLQNLY
ncbi:MAG: hypothetical protein H6609_01675 [Ignavibacteriales bacterium]|nr:hypothetical protein [Ignavibacteriales bacterium]